MQLEFTVLPGGQIRISTYNTETDDCDILGEVADSTKIGEWINATYPTNDVYVWDPDQAEWVLYTR